MESRVFVELLTNRGVPGVASFGATVRDLRLWQAADTEVIVRSYARYPFIKDYPIITPHLLGQYLRDVQGLSIGTKTSGGYGDIPYAYCALEQYIQAQLLFDVDQDIDQLIADFNGFVWGQASDEMTAFTAVMEQCWLDGNPVDLLRTTYRADRLAEPMALLAAAAEKLGDDNPLFNDLYAKFKGLYQTACDYAAADNLQPVKPKTYRLPTLEVPVVIDGRIDVAEWSDAVWQPLGFAVESTTNQPTMARWKADEHALYLALRATEPTPSAMKVISDAPQIWAGDSFEIFLTPSAKRYPYYQFCVNPRGAIWGTQWSRTDQPELDVSPVQVAGRIDDDRYELELAIPFDMIGGNAAGPWRFHVHRNRVCGEGDAAQTSSLGIPGGSPHWLWAWSRLER